MGWLQKLRERNAVLYALENAAGRGNLDEVRRLLAEGYFPDAGAFRAAASEGHREVTQELINAIKKQDPKLQVSVLSSGDPFNDNKLSWIALAVGLESYPEGRAECKDMIKTAKAEAKALLSKQSLEEKYGKKGDQERSR